MIGGGESGHTPDSPARKLSGRLFFEVPKSWEDAAQQAVGQVAKTVCDVRSVYIHDMEAGVGNGEIKTYRVNARVTFALENS
ncbi:MAG TPA: dodecin family protein [Gammaproteobacteria bacterium]|nr:dodecin family protein [Gammaproteobacteria bacterium]